MPSARSIAASISGSALDCAAVTGCFEVAGCWSPPADVGVISVKLSPGFNSTSVDEVDTQPVRSAPIKPTMTSDMKNFPCMDDQNLTGQNPIGHPGPQATPPTVVYWQKN